MKTVELDAIVREYLFSQGYNTTHKYLRVMKILVEFLGKFSRSHSYMDKQDLFKVDEKLAIQLPSDFHNLGRLAFISGDRLINFERDNSINTSFSYVDDVASATKNTAFNIGIFERPTIGNWPTFDCLLNSNSFSPVGKGHNQVGYFNFNWPAREIQFSTDARVSSDVFMRYKTNGFNPTTRSTIPEFAQPVAEAYIKWQVGRNTLGDGSPETDARRINYLRVYDDMIAQLDPIDYQSIVGSKARASDLNKIIS